MTSCHVVETELSIEERINAGWWECDLCGEWYEPEAGRNDE